MDPHSCIVQFLRRSAQRPWKTPRDFPQTGSACRSVPKAACRRRSRKPMGVWPAPSTAPRIMGCTEESCFGTGPPRRHSLKPKLSASARRHTKRKTFHTIRSQSFLGFAVRVAHPSSVFCFLKVVVSVPRRGSGSFLSSDDALSVVPFAGEHLITDVVLNFDLKKESL